MIGNFDDDDLPSDEPRAPVDQAASGRLDAGEARAGAFYAEQPERIYGIQEDDEDDDELVGELLAPIPSANPLGAGSQEQVFGGGDRQEQAGQGTLDPFDDDDDDDEIGRTASQEPARAFNGVHRNHSDASGAESAHAGTVPAEPRQSSAPVAPSAKPAPREAAPQEPVPGRFMATGMAPVVSAPAGQVPGKNPPDAAQAGAVPAGAAPADAVPGSAMPEQQGASPARPMSDVRRFIDPSLERKVVKKIFVKNRTDYEAALDRLNSAQNWKLASQVLDELFIRYNVDPYSRTAIRFTDSVYGRYLP